MYRGGKREKDGLGSTRNIERGCKEDRARAVVVAAAAVAVVEVAAAAVVVVLLMVVVVMVGKVYMYKCEGTRDTYTHPDTR